MKRLLDLDALDRLDGLIRHRATGSPEELAIRMHMSRSNLFKMIKFLREEMNAPVSYNKDGASYVYSYKFYLGFERKSLNATDFNNSYNDGEKNDNEEDSGYEHEIDDDDDDFNLDDDIEFNELYH